MEDFDRLKQVVVDVEADVAKFDAGNKAAGTRVRKAMMEIKNLAQTIRKGVSAKKAPAPAPAAIEPPAAPQA